MTTPRKFEELEISAIVPAYNEAGNIVSVLTPLGQVPAIREIIVVSDGSTDGTAQSARDFGGVKVIELPQNVGKTKAVLRGVGEARYPVILLCDADLVNLSERHVAGMVRAYCEGWDMVIMDKGSQPWVFRRLLRSVPAVSGTRMLGREFFDRIPFREGDRFRLENRINDYFLWNRLGIAVSPAGEVYDRRKFVKYPFWRGLYLDVKGGWEVMTSDGVWNIPRIMRSFWRIHRLSR
jgi:glycosyltransferase involved in cell wall biosynthesis